MGIFIPKFFGNQEGGSYNFYSPSCREAFGMCSRPISWEMFSDSRNSSRIVLALPLEGIINDPLQEIVIPIETLPVKGGRWLGDAWSLYDANGTLLADAAIDNKDELGERLADNITFSKPSSLTDASGAIQFYYTPTTSDGGTLIKCGDIDITCTDNAIIFGTAEYLQNFVVGVEYAVRIFWIYDFIAIGVDSNYDVATNEVNSLEKIVHFGSNDGIDVAIGEFPIAGDKAPKFYSSPVRAGWVEIIAATNPDGSSAFNPNGSIAYNPPIIIGEGG